MKYDDAKSHYGGDFPAGSPQEFGGTHIGLLLKWCYMKGWAGELQLQDVPEAVEMVRRGEKAGTDFLFQQCDGKFIDEDLNDEGNAFIGSYYGKGGQYLEDYAKNFEHQMYIASEAEHNFELFSAMVERRYNAFIIASGGAP